MRGIKFRAWDKEFKKFSRIAQNISVKDIQYSTDYEWMQYTGLKDKNGKEIYEGDILAGTPTMHTMTVVWYKACFCVKFKDLGTEYVIPLENEEENIFEQFDIEVIGNIYENPELLEVA